MIYRNALRGVMEYWIDGALGADPLLQYSNTSISPVCHYSAPPPPTRVTSPVARSPQPLHTLPRKSAFVDDRAGLALKTTPLMVGETCRGNHGHGYQVHLQVRFEGIEHIISGHIRHLQIEKH